MNAKARAQAEWSRMQDRQAERTRIERLNDRSLEGLILLARASSVLAALSVVVFVCVGILEGDWRIFAVCGVQAAAGGFAGWFGWWHYGNEEWRSRGST